MVFNTSFSTHSYAISIEYFKLNIFDHSGVRSVLHKYDGYVRDVVQRLEQLTDTTSNGNSSNFATVKGWNMSLKSYIDLETL